ncbi:hypothetical protein [Lactococcus phage PMBT68]|nr:hypothetical protein [Lactococcus phage P1411]
MNYGIGNNYSIKCNDYPKGVHQLFVRWWKRYDRFNTSVRYSLIS